MYSGVRSLTLCGPDLMQARCAQGVQEPKAPQTPSLFKFLYKSIFEFQVECREDTRDTCVLEEVMDPRMIRDGRDGTTVSKM